MILSRRFLLAALSAAGLLPIRAGAAAPLRVGVMDGEGEALMEGVAEQAKGRGLALRVIAFSDYQLPNEALSHGDLDANAFQHQPYLDNQVKTRGYKIVPDAYTIGEPFGLYKRNYTSV